MDSIPGYNTVAAARSSIDSGTGNVGDTALNNLPSFKNMILAIQNAKN